MVELRWRRRRKADAAKVSSSRDDETGEENGEDETYEEPEVGKGARRRGLRGEDGVDDASGRLLCDGCLGC